MVRKQIGSTDLVIKDIVIIYSMLCDIKPNIVFKCLTRFGTFSYNIYSTSVTLWTPFYEKMRKPTSREECKSKSHNWL